MNNIGFAFIILFIYFHFTNRDRIAKLEERVKDLETKVHDLEFPIS